MASPASWARSTSNYTIHDANSYTNMSLYLNCCYLLAIFIKIFKDKVYGAHKIIKKF